MSEPEERLPHRRRLSSESALEHALRSPRLPVLAVVVIALALAGMANALVRNRHAAAAVERATPDATVTLSRSVSSAAWYCPGPLPIGHDSWPSEVVVTNLGEHRLSGEVVVASTNGAVATDSLSLHARATQRQALIVSGPARQAAVTVLLDGSGAAVEELVGSPSGPEVTPCSARTSPTAYLAAGGSQGADNVELALFDPGATPAVANVTLGTSTGAVAPPAFQGVPVSAGSLVLLDLGRTDPGQRLLATSVSTTGGEVVAGALITVARGHGVETTLATAYPSAATTWTMPPTPAGPGTVETLAVYDPGSTASKVTLVSEGAGVAAEATATVPAGGVVDLSPGGSGSAGAVRFEQLAVTAGGPVVVDRQLALESASPPAAPVKRTVVRLEQVKVNHHLVARQVSATVLLHPGPFQPTLLPALPVGYAVGAALSDAGTRFVLPVGEQDLATGEVVAIADPGNEAARVRLEPLALSGQPTPRLGALPRLIVPAHGTLTVSLIGLVRPAGEVPLVLDSSAPVAVSDLLYARNGKAPIGIATPVAIPVEG